MRFVSFADPLPTDPDALRALLLAEREKHAEEIAAADQNIARLTAIIKELQRHRFGARSEKIDADQLALMHRGCRAGAGCGDRGIREEAEQRAE